MSSLCDIYILYICFSVPQFSLLNQKHIFLAEPYLYIGKTAEKGRGVFTNAAIPADTVIEIAPVIVMSAEDRKHLDKTLLHDYIFIWGETGEECCMALGYVPIYNHNYSSNCEYFMDFEEHTILVKTICNIEAGEELTINYNGDWNDSKKIWFDVK